MGGTNLVDEMDCGSFFDHIDDLIDFPSENECAGGVGSGDGDSFPGIWNQPLPDSDPIFSAAAANSASDLSAELSVPYEDIVQLEWLSTFVEESFSGRGLTLAKEHCPKYPKPSPPYTTTTTNSNESKTTAVAPAAASPISVLESSSSSSSSYSCPRGMVMTMPLSPSQRGPHRARSKRPRPVAFNPPRPVMQLIETLQAVAGPEPLLQQEEEEKKKMKKRIKFSMASSSGTKVPRPHKQEREEDDVVRKCMHCEITKTPQWRAGPMGPKTLCNACGVRYKSGRLFPEYRPAASPTFVASVHSNSHKKVVEMRSRASGVPAAPPEIK